MSDLYKMCMSQHYRVCNIFVTPGYLGYDINIGKYHGLPGKGYNCLQMEFICLTLIDQTQIIYKSIFYQTNSNDHRVQGFMMVYTTWCASQVEPPQLNSYNLYQKQQNSRLKLKETPLGPKQLASPKQLGPWLDLGRFYKLNTAPSGYQDLEETDPTRFSVIVEQSNFSLRPCLRAKLFQWKLHLLPDAISNTKQIRKHIKSLDNFGIPIAFTYKKSTHVKSFTGGLMTLIAYCMVFAFFLYQCKNVFVRDFSLQTLTTKRDLQYNSDIINVTQKQLDFGIRLEYYLREFEPEVQKNLDQYVEVSVSQNVYTWKLDQQGLPIFDKQKQTTELIPCQIGRLGSSKNKKDYLNLEADYLCPKDVNYQIQGSFSGEVSRFIQIAVKSCNQAALNKKYNNTKKCVSESETMRVAAQLKLYMLMENSFFDESNFDGDYIKKFLKPYYLTSLYNQSIYYYMTLQQNKIQMNDNIFYSFNEPRLAQTFETQIDYNVVSPLNPKKNLGIV